MRGAWPRGINIVRLHHLDNDFARGQGKGVTIWDIAGKDHQCDSAQLDQLDYFVYQLKRNGIYIDMNLKCSKNLTRADGFPEGIAKTGYMQKAIDYFDPRMIELQKEYARGLLTHTNPYTHLTYAEDPVVACVEINNENTLVGNPLGKGLDAIPDPFKSDAERLWTKWLKNEYRDTAGVKAAWMKGVASPGAFLIGSADRWSFENAAGTRVQFTTTPGRAGVTPSLNADIQQVDGTSWSIQSQISGLTLKEGATYTLSFRARADAKRKMGVCVCKDVDDWHRMGLMTDANLGTDWNDYSFTFKAVNARRTSVGVNWGVGPTIAEFVPAQLTLKVDGSRKVLRPRPRRQAIQKGAGHLPRRQADVRCEPGGCRAPLRSGQGLSGSSGNRRAKITERRRLAHCRF